jgi:hypothetical protein
MPINDGNAEYDIIVTVSQQTLWCDGTGQVWILSDNFPCCPPTSAMCMSPTHSGTWKAPRN